MFSGSLPLATYHRAQSLGAGTYGSVMTVYNSDGEEFALKLFFDDDDDNSDEGYSNVDSGTDLGALREISILRILRHENKHENIIEMADVKMPAIDEIESGEYDDYGGGAGAGTSGYLGMAMPVYYDGNLADAIDKGVLKSSRQKKVMVAHGLLSAVAFLHDNGVIHRDIKADNVMISYKSNGEINPILIDFSLAKFFDCTVYNGKTDKLDQEMKSSDFWKGNTHTGQIGTITYRAPEIISQKAYGLKSDLWSVGVVLLEMITNHTLTATKDKEAAKMIEEMLESLPDNQPFPTLIRGLLQVDPKKRFSARAALDSPLFQKFGLLPPKLQLLDLELALPLDYSDEEEENHSGNSSDWKPKSKRNNQMLKRKETIMRLCSFLGYKHPLTPQAAFTYCQQMYQLDDTLDDLDESQTMHDCVILAYKFFEKELINLEELEEETFGPFKNWSLEEYRDNEASIWMIMDYCLYPRTLINWDL